MRYRGLGVIFIAVLTAMFASAASAATVDVELGVYWFCDPSYQDGVCETKIVQGDTVHWEVVEGIGHSVTECGADCDSPTGTPLFDSGGINIGNTYDHTFEESGTFLYYCQGHPTQMRGRVVVFAAVGGESELAGGAVNSAADSEAQDGANALLIGALAVVGAATLLTAGWVMRRFIA
ncbi:MAG: plastocyanin/azurin family copper-binding protein [Dehalococcoidia bacterium]